MRKIKKLLTLFTAALVAVSLALSSGVAGALSQEEIGGYIQNLVIHYNQEDHNKRLSDHEGWLSLFLNVLDEAEATEADVHAVGPYETGHWADWISHAQGFKAVPNAEANNLRAMLTNFGHDEGYFQSGWRVKNDFKLLEDWGGIIYTTQNRNGEEKPYLVTLYDESRMLHRIREIYNLDPTANAQKYDALCLRSILRAMVAYDRSFGLDHESDGLDSFVDAIAQTGLWEELIYLVANDSKTKTYLETNEDFSLMDRIPRQNAVVFYKKLASLLLRSHYSEGDNLLSGQAKIEGIDYEIVFDDNGYVLRIDPIVSAQNGAGGGASSPAMVTLQGDKAKSSAASAASGGGGGGGGGRIIKGTGSGIDHFAAAVVALVVSASGIAGLGYVVSRKKRRNVK